MKTKKAIILAAGFGKRMLPITKVIPKPLIKIQGITLLENSIKFLSKLGIKYIVINAHYHHRELVRFLKNKKFQLKIKIIIERKKILNTGGGVLNASKQFKKDEPFFVVNPDTIWRNKYRGEFKKLEEMYLKNKKSTMLLVSKNKSFDKSFRGDFNLNSKNEIFKQKNNKFIFTGAQIINRSIFKKRKIKPFSMNKVWGELINKQKLLGIKSTQKFFHLNNYKTYKKLKKKIIH